MTIEILNTLTEVDGKWFYTGQFLWNAQKIPLSGLIEKIESKTRLKQVLRGQVENYIQLYIAEHQPANTLTIPVGGVFVEVLS